MTLEQIHVVKTYQNDYIWKSSLELSSSFQLYINPSHFSRIITVTFWSKSWFENPILLTEHLHSPLGLNGFWCGEFYQPRYQKYHSTVAVRVCCSSILCVVVLSLRYCMSSFACAAVEWTAADIDSFSTLHFPLIVCQPPPWSEVVCTPPVWSVSNTFPLIRNAFVRVEWATGSCVSQSTTNCVLLLQCVSVPPAVLHEYDSTDCSTAKYCSFVFYFYLGNVTLLKHMFRYFVHLTVLQTINILIAEC